MSVLDDIFRQAKRRRRANVQTSSLFDERNERFRKGNDDTPQITPPSNRAPTAPEGGQEHTVFVGNLSLATKQLPKKVKRLFKQYGEVASVRLRSVPSATGDSTPKRVVVQKRRYAEDASCNAYVVFREAAAAEAALVLNMTQFEGRAIRVNGASARRFQRPKKRTSGVAPGDFSAKDSICVKSLDASISDDALLKVFNDGALLPLCRNTVRNWRIVRDHKTGRSKGYAFVAFKNSTAARAASALDGHKLADQAIKIEPLQKTDAPSRRPVRAFAAGGCGGVKKRRAWGGRVTKGRFKMRQRR